jgi:hypothetical protein
MSTTYRKTEKGRTEVATRAARLSPRLRGLLILVDGQRSAEALGALVTVGADALLAELADGGFIEPVAASRPSPGPAASPQVSLRERQQQAVRYLTERLGPTADSVAMRIEAARNPDDLRTALGLAETVLRQQHGTSAAAGFRALFIDPPV